ncbi:ATP-dependent DNA ligase [bacterium]|nr:ATP-dependent DNA ligase [bacterium]
MKFIKFAEYLQKLENTAKRLEITDILTNLIKNLDQKETDIAVYLASGYLKAPFESQKFNIAEKMMIKILDHAYNTDKAREMYKEMGDLGNVAYKLAKTRPAKHLNVAEVHEKMLSIAEIEGAGSQDRKISKGAELLTKLDPLSAKYAVRIILGTTRLGFTEITVIEALSNLLAGDKSLKKNIEAKYNIHPDIGLIAKQIKKSGLKGIQNINIVPGVPLLSQKAQRLGSMDEIIDKLGLVWAEFKFDGTRVQLHLDRNKKGLKRENTQKDMFDSSEDKFMIKTFTRNLEETTHQYPDIILGAKNQIDANSVILDGEAIGYNPETGTFLPFQETIQRKRKHGISESAQNIPLKYFVFDILYLNGKSTADKPLRERRKILKKVIKKGETIILGDHIETDTSRGLDDYFKEAVKRKLEGLIVKRPNDAYQAGARAFSWVKLKIADENLAKDSVDCVVLGYYAGRGARSKFGIGGFLVGVYDPKTDGFKTISKVGTGLTDETWVKLKEMADKHKIDKLPSNVDVNKNLVPDIIISPKIVVEIGADEITKSPIHTAGYALRFPRLLKFREDKSAKEATTVNEIRQGL